jgi:hypothetical protein
MQHGRPIGREQRRSQGQREVIRVDNHEDAVGELVQPRFCTKFRGGPVSVNLTVGVQEEGVLFSNEAPTGTDISGLEDIETYG